MVKQYPCMVITDCVVTNYYFHSFPLLTKSCFKAVYFPSPLMSQLP